MDAVFPPFLVRDRFARVPSRPAGGPVVPWAVRISSVPVGRQLLDRLLEAGARSGQIVAAADGAVYVRWTE